MHFNIAKKNSQYVIAISQNIIYFWFLPFIIMYDERHIEQTDLNRNLNSHTFSFVYFSFALLLCDIQHASAFACAIEE